MRDVGAWVCLTERCNFLHILDEGVVVARFGIFGEDDGDSGAPGKK